MIYYIQKVKENTNKTRKETCMTYTKNVVDADLRNRVFSALLDDFENNFFVKINDRQYGCILTDKNGHKRYIRLGAIVAEERDDMTAEELMASEIAKYNETQEKKAEKKRNSEEKAKRDKELREKKAQEKAKKKEEEDNPNQYLEREIAV